MLRVTRAQRNAYAEVKRCRLIEKSHRFLEQAAPAWTRDRSPTERGALIEAVVDLAHSCHIFEEANVQALMLHKIVHDYALPLSAYQRHVLGRKHFDERHRMAQFVEALTERHNLTKIALATDIGEKGASA